MSITVRGTFGDIAPGDFEVDDNGTRYWEALEVDNDGTHVHVVARFFPSRSIDAFHAPVGTRLLIERGAA